MATNWEAILAFGDAKACSWRARRPESRVCLAATHSGDRGGWRLNGDHAPQQQRWTRRYVRRCRIDWLCNKHERGRTAVRSARLCSVLVPVTAELGDQLPSAAQVLCAAGSSAGTKTHQVPTGTPRSAPQHEVLRPYSITTTSRTFLLCHSRRARCKRAHSRTLSARTVRRHQTRWPLVANKCATELVSGG